MSGSDKYPQLNIFTIVVVLNSMYLIVSVYHYLLQWVFSADCRKCNRFANVKSLKLKCWESSPSGSERLSHHINHYRVLQLSI